MKKHYLIAPVSAVLALGIWMNQESALAKLEEKNRVVTKRIRQVESLVSAPSLKPTMESPEDHMLLPDGSLDWKSLEQRVAEIRETTGSSRDIRDMLKGHLKALTEEELEDAFLKISDQGFSEESSSDFRKNIISHLIDKNPETAMRLMGDKMLDFDEPLRWYQQHGYRQFVLQDPAAALAWLDQRISNPQLDTKAISPDRPNSELMAFESPLLRSLFEHDRPAMEARLAKLTKGQIYSALSNNGSNSWKRDGKMALEFLEITRKHLDPKSAAKVIAQTWANPSMDFQQVSQSLNEISFSEDEQSAIVERAVVLFINAENRNGDQNESYKAASEWVQQQLPGYESPFLARKKDELGDLSGNRN